MPSLLALLLFLVDASGPTVARDVLETAPNRRQPRAQPGELLAVQLRQPCQARGAFHGEPKTHHTLVVVRLHTTHQPCGLGAVDEADDAVMARDQLGGALGDGGITVPPPSRSPTSWSRAIT